jgi:hypothetical protein
VFLSHVMLGLFSILLQPCCLNALPSRASALWVFNEVSLLKDPPDVLTGSVEAAEDAQTQEATWINSLRQSEDRNINEEARRQVFVYDEKDSNAQKSSRHEYDDDEDYSWDKRFQNDPLEHSDSEEKMSDHSDYDAQEISLDEDDVKKISFHEDADSIKSSRHEEGANEISFNDDDVNKISFHEDDDSMESSRHEEDANEISFNDDEASDEGRQQETESYEELLQILDMEIGEIFSLKINFLYFFFVI